MSKTNSYDYKEVRKNINRAMDKYGVTLSALCYMIEDKFRIEYGTIYSRFRQIMSDDWAPTLSDELLAKYEKELRASLQSNSLLEKQQSLQNKNSSMLGAALGIV